MGGLRHVLMTPDTMHFEHVSSPQGKKDFKLLSFGEEADQEEKELEAQSGVTGRGIKSAHDALDDDKFSKDAAYDVEAVRKAGGGAIAATDESLRKAVKEAARGAAAAGSRYVLHAMVTCCILGIYG